MIKGLREFTKFAAFPIGMLIILGIFLVTYQALGLPSFDEIVQFAKEQFEVHGYWVVFIAALLEGFLLLNWFFPGSIVIVMGTVFANNGEQSLALTLGLIMLGLYLMSILNFYIGKYGWYKLFLKFGLKQELDRMKHRLEKHGLIILLLTYIHPHVGSLTSTAAGILHIKTSSFLLWSLLAYIIWGGIWSTVVYFLGDQMLSIINYQNLVIIVVAWIFVMGIQYWVKTFRKRSDDILVETEE